LPITLQPCETNDLVERLPRPRAVLTGPIRTLDSRPAPADRVQRSTRALLVVFVVFTLLAVNQLLVLGAHTERFWAWPLPFRPSSAFLGAAYAAGSVLSVLALRQTRWSHVRVPVLTVTLFTVLTLVPTVLHRHRMNLMEHGVARIAAVVWVAVYVAVPVAGALVVLRQWRASRPGAQVVGLPMPRWVVAVLLVQGAALAAVGAVLYVGGMNNHMTVAVAWPGWAWPVTPLTGMAIGAWLLSFAIAVVLAVRERDMSTMFVSAVAYAVFGAAEVAVMLSHRSAAGVSPLWLWTDVVLFASLVPVGLYGALVAARTSADSSPRRQQLADSRFSQVNA
jgi:hypothetical protein